MRDISARVSSPPCAVRRMPLAGAVAAEAEAAGGAAPAWALVGRTIVSRIASIGSLVDVIALVADWPATWAPVCATLPAAERRRAAPISTPTAHTRPPWRP